MPERLSREMFFSAVLAFLTGIGASFLLMALVVLLTASARAEAADEPTSGTLHVHTASGRLIRNVPRLDTRVRISVSGMLARVKVEQRFRNPSPEWVEALYVFPLPEDSAVDHMRMRFAGQVIEGEIQEKEQARRVYEKARQAGRRASLLQQQRPNIFTTSVANVPPGEEIQVEIEYQQAVKVAQGSFSLRFPMVVGPRYIPGEALATESIDGVTSGFDGHGWAANTDQVPDASHITPPVIGNNGDVENLVRLEVLLDAGIELERVESPYHEITIETVGQGARRIRLGDEKVRADRDFVLKWSPAVAQMPHAALFAEQWRDRHYTLLMVMPPSARSLDAKALPARELILVVDTSGSMYGESMEQARRALRLALGKLRPQDAFNIIQFNDRFEALHPHAVPADKAHLEQALHYVDRLEADGGTEMQPAMRFALAHPGDGTRLRQVVFLTDGDIGNEQALFSTIVNHLGDARLFPVGIGSAPNSYFMTRAARFGRGSYTFIGSLDEVEQQMRDLFGRLASPVMTDITVAWADDSPLSDAACDGQQYPEPDLYAGEPLMLVRCSAKPLRSALIEGRVGKTQWRREVQLGGGVSAPGVHVLWARRSIADLMAIRTLHGDAQQVREHIVRLALRHHLVSDYTSLVAVDKTPVRPLEDALHTKPVATHLPKGWHKAKVFGQLPQTGTSAPMQILAGMMALILGWFVRRRWRT